MFNKMIKEAPGLSENRVQELLLFQNTINQNFDDLSLLENALIHSSFANEAKDDLIKDNERLEFLGDSVLSLIVSEFLYNNLSGNEGFYTKTRSIVVSEDTLAKVARKIQVNKYIEIGHGEEQSGGRDKNAILADCVEAVIAAIYLDRGFDAAKSFVLSYLIDEINLVLNNNGKKDYKTILQEYVQKRYKIVPVYELVETNGPEHDQVFYYTVKFKNQIFGPESGKNKKEAEQNVAKIALESLNLVH